jgi:hypothetical protein
LYINDEIESFGDKFGVVSIQQIIHLNHEMKFVVVLISFFVVAAAIVEGDEPPFRHGFAAVPNHYGNSSDHPRHHGNSTGLPKPHGNSTRHPRPPISAKVAGGPIIIIN